MQRLFLAAIILLLSSFKTGSDIHSFAYEITGLSRISISGRSNLTSFQCASVEGQKGSTFAFQKSDSDYVSFFNASVPIRVKSLSCSNTLINRDLYKTLRAERYPFIQLNVKSAKLLAAYPNNTYRYLVVADLNIANVIKETKGEVIVQKLGDAMYRFTGKYAIKLSSFNIQQPTAMFGLIVVEDEIMIDYNLVVKVQKDFLGL